MSLLFQVLRWAKGYDNNQILLLPLREAGTSLPSELMEAFANEEKQREKEKKMFEEKKREQDENELEGEEKKQLQVDGQEVESTAAIGLTNASSTLGVTADSLVSVSAKVSATDITDKERMATAASSMHGIGAVSAPERSVAAVSKLMLETNMGSLADVELSPVALAVARYLGVDFSSEAVAARGRRGMALIVHGAPYAGKTMHATDLATCYKCALITIDGVIRDALERRNTPAARKAYQQLVELMPSKPEGEQDKVEVTVADNTSKATDAPVALESIKSVRSEKGLAALESSKAVRSEKTSSVSLGSVPADDHCPNIDQLPVAAIADSLAVEILSDRLKVSVFCSA